VCLLQSRGYGSLLTEYAYETADLIGDLVGSTVSEAVPTVV